MWHEKLQYALRSKVKISAQISYPKFCDTQVSNAQRSISNLMTVTMCEAFEQHRGLLPENVKALEGDREKESETFSCK